MLWFEREEFDRYARFHSRESTREVFTWKKLCETKIPVPPIEIRDKIVQINEIILNCINIKEKLTTIYNTFYFIKQELYLSMNNLNLKCGIF